MKSQISNVPQFGPRTVSSQRKISNGFSLFIYLASVYHHFCITFPIGVRINDAERERWRREERVFVYLGIHNQEIVKDLTMIPPATAQICLY